MYKLKHLVTLEQQQFGEQKRGIFILNLQNLNKEKMFTDLWVFITKMISVFF